MSLQCTVAMAASFSILGESDELGFNKNDLIMLIARIGDGQWLRGRNMKGDVGIFPLAFVEIVVCRSPHYRCVE